MWRAATALIVALNLLACPYLCRGILFGCCDNPDCAANRTRSDQQTPASPNDPDPCQNLGTSCICTGAPADEVGRTCVQFETMFGVVHFDSGIQLVTQFTPPSATEPRWANWRQNISRPKLRALLDSYLL